VQQPEPAADSLAS
jgi:hypothetical protein